MKDANTPRMKFNCPVLIGPGWLEYMRGISPLFIGVSLMLHALLLFLLPSASNQIAVSLPRTILIKLQAAVPVIPNTAIAAQKVEAQPVAQASRLAPIHNKLPAQPQPPGRKDPAPPGHPPPLAAPTSGGTVQPGAVVGAASGNGTTVASGNGVGAGGSSSGPATGLPAATGLPGGSGTNSSPATSPFVPPPAPAPLKPQPRPEPAIDIKSLLASYAGGVKASILRHKAYPAIAERLGHEGAVKVSFAVDSTGSLLSASVRSSSGFDELDQAALDAVRGAAPFDSIPAEAGKGQLNLSITLKFSLGG